MAFSKDKKLECTLQLSRQTVTSTVLCARISTDKHLTRSRECTLPAVNAVQFARQPCAPEARAGICQDVHSVRQAQRAPLEFAH